MYQLKTGKLPVEELSGEPFLIEPAWAVWALEKYNTHNRRKLGAVVDQFAAEVKAGTWLLTHQGIAFSTEPVFLIDGQHRLFGIVAAKTAAVMRIFLGQNPASQLCIDDHRPRKAADALTLTGLDVTHTEVAIATAMKAGPTHHFNRVRQSRADLRAFLTAHLDAVRFAMSKGKARGATSASVLAVVARAYYHEDAEKLRRFLHTLISSIPEPDDEASATILTLRKYLTERSPAALGSSGKVEVYRKVQWMLRAYLDGNTSLKCIGSEKDLFPLPQE